MELIKFNDVGEKIITLRNQPVMLDSDVAELYEVQTKEINQAVRNNPKKFPQGYIFELDKEEVTNLRSKFLTTNLTMSRVLPKAFTEKGLYMLATILKSPKAVETTLAIVETYAKFRELTIIAADMIKTPEDSEKQAKFMQKTNELLTDVITKELKTTATETTFEFNLMSAVKIKHTIKKEIK
jgi:hypothetical protein